MKNPKKQRARGWKSRSGIRLFLGVLSSVIAGALLLALGLAALLLYMNAPPETQTGFSPENPAWERGVAFEYDEASPAAKSALVEVREGESSYAVGKRLERAGLIKTRLFWNILSRLDKSFVKAGTYRVQLPATQIALRSTLVEGRQLLFSVTIPEGITLKKTARILEDSGICGAEDFLSAAADRALLDEYRVPGKSLEGYLYPETYFFPGMFPAENVVRAMADTFFDKLREIAPESATLTPEELDDIIIIASIVEREYRVKDEAAVMAGVFYNRVKIGMALQSCATVEYIITDIQGKPHPRVLYNRDIEINNPYNTYIIPGLPPGPISMPGATALDAAFHPKDTNFLYFRLIDEAAGRHYFSRTFDDHIKAGALFVKGNS
ncbi:MAG: endolytic transglycosylase MltG [Treponema sp.]|nr:endolytic transglycosylase MltG [Treponema sp.]